MPRRCPDQGCEPGHRCGRGAQGRRRHVYQIIINNIGTIFNQYTEGASPSGDISWNAELEHAVHTQDDYWSLEVSFPLAQFSDQAVETETVWGANLAHIRIANVSDYGQWVPIDGSALEPGRIGFWCSSK